jgi:hypothetical protein
MKYRLVTIMLVVAMGLAAARVALTHETPPKPRLTNAASSIPDLLESFRQALINKDKKALRALRVNEEEYLGIILPGSVEPGQPHAEYTEQAQKYFWGILNGRSIYVEANLLADYGNHPFHVVETSYRKGVKDYATYKAYKQLQLLLEDDAGKQDHLSIGSIVEVDGQYKFISYVRD